VLAGEGRPSVIVQQGLGSTGHYTVNWRVAPFKRCVATGGVAMSGSIALPGFVTAEVGLTRAPHAADVEVYNAQGVQAALPFWVAVLC
jgi:hypothetical protein